MRRSDIVSAIKKQEQDRGLYSRARGLQDIMLALNKFTTTDLGINDFNSYVDKELTLEELEALIDILVRNQANPGSSSLIARDSIIEKFGVDKYRAANILYSAGIKKPSLYLSLMVRRNQQIIASFADVLSHLNSDPTLKPHFNLLLSSLVSYIGFADFIKQYCDHLSPKGLLTKDTFLAVFPSIVHINGLNKALSCLSTVQLDQRDVIALHSPQFLPHLSEIFSNIDPATLPKSDNISYDLVSLLSGAIYVLTIIKTAFPEVMVQFMVQLCCKSILQVDNKIREGIDTLHKNTFITKETVLIMLHDPLHADGIADLLVALKNCGFSVSDFADQVKINGAHSTAIKAAIALCAARKALSKEALHSLFKFGGSALKGANSRLQLIQYDIDEKYVELLSEHTKAALSISGGLVTLKLGDCLDDQNVDTMMKFPENAYAVASMVVCLHRNKLLMDNRTSLEKFAPYVMEMLQCPDPLDQPTLDALFDKAEDTMKLIQRAEHSQQNGDNGLASSSSQSNNNPNHFGSPIHTAHSNGSHVEPQLPAAEWMISTVIGKLMNW